MDYVLLLFFLQILNADLVSATSVVVHLIVSLLLIIRTSVVVPEIQETKLLSGGSKFLISRGTSTKILG